MFVGAGCSQACSSCPLPLLLLLEEMGERAERLKFLESRQVWVLQDPQYSVKQQVKGRRKMFAARGRFANLMVPARSRKVNE